MPAFIENGGMQSYSVSRYLGRRSTPTVEHEYEWYEKVRNSHDTVTWGVWDISTTQQVLIGNTTLMSIEQSPLRQATSGVLIFRQDYWGKGIAKHIHRARTMYAFDELQLVRIRSAVMLPNIASRKALESVGYFPHSVERNVKFIGGDFVHQQNMECLSPHKHAWQSWWGSERPTRAALQARVKTQEALAWARKHVTYP